MVESLYAMMAYLGMAVCILVVLAVVAYLLGALWTDHVMLVTLRHAERVDATTQAIPREAWDAMQRHGVPLRARLALLGTPGVALARRPALAMLGDPQAELDSATWVQPGIRRLACEYKPARRRLARLRRSAKPTV